MHDVPPDPPPPEKPSPPRPRAKPRKPSDLLKERGAVLRRFAYGEDPPTIEQLMKHATKFGRECVVETAAELGYGLDACVRLTDHCDRAEVAAYLSEHPNGRSGPKFDDAIKRCKLLLGIEDQQPEVAVA